MDIIDNVVRRETSLVVVAYELLVVATKDDDDETLAWSAELVGSEEGISESGLEEFCEQCYALYDNIVSERTEGSLSTFVTEESETNEGNRLYRHKNRGNKMIDENTDRDDINWID